MRNFSPAVAGFTQAGALMSLNVAVVTYMGCRKTSGALSSKVFNSGVSALGIVVVEVEVEVAVLVVWVVFVFVVVVDQGWSVV